MFYCEECRVKKDWPDSIGRSCGSCEICGQTKICYNVPSKALPMPKAKTQAEEMRQLTVEALEGTSISAQQTAQLEWRTVVLVKMRAAARKGNCRISYRVGGSTAEETKLISKALQKIAKDEGFEVTQRGGRVVKLLFSW